MFIIDIKNSKGKSIEQQVHWCDYQLLRRGYDCENLGYCIDEETGEGYVSNYETDNFPDDDFFEKMTSLDMFKDVLVTLRYEDISGNVAGKEAYVEGKKIYEATPDGVTVFVPNEPNTVIPLNKNMTIRKFVKDILDFDLGYDFKCQNCGEPCTEDEIGEECNECGEIIVVEL